MKTHKLRVGFRQQIDARLIISDLDGSHPRQFRFDSFTDNFIRQFRGLFLQGNSLGISLVGSGGASAGVYTAQSLTTGYLNGGIILGTGAPSRSASMYALGTPLSADDVEFTPLFIDVNEDTEADTSEIVLSKHFTNISGGDLSITEIGLSFSVGATYYLFSHDAINYTFSAAATKKFSLVISLGSVFTRNFTRVLAGTHSAYLATITDISNTERVSTVVYGSLAYLRWYFESSYTNTGLQIGTGSGAEDITSYDLGARLTTASLEFAESTCASAVYGDGDPRFIMSRLFKNITASPLVINEVGISGWLRYTSSSPYKAVFLLFRKKLLIPVTIDPGEWASFEIEFYTDFE